MNQYPPFLGVDLGTTNVRSFIFNEKGEVLEWASRGIKIYNPKPGWAEQEPEEIWKATLDTMRDSVKALRSPADDIAMVSFSAQMHGMCLINKDGKTLTRLLTWLDLRAALQCEKLSEILDPYELYSRTGCPPLFIYSPVKILWAKENAPKKFEECHKVLSAKDYVMYKIFGEPYLDYSVASGSQLLNIQKLKLDEKSP